MMLANDLYKRVASIVLFNGKLETKYSKQDAKFLKEVLYILCLESFPLQNF